MPRGACTLLRGPTNCPQRLLVVAYIATTMSPTPCRATTSWNGLQATQQAPAIEKTAGAPVCMTGPACCSMQRHGQPTALSQLFPFTPSERERLCTLLRVCIHRWGPPRELVCMTETATTACNCMGSQQPCHNYSRSLGANENDYAHSLECASTTEDLQEVPRIRQTSQALQTLQAPHPALIHKSQRGQGATDRPVCFRCFLQVTMKMRAPWEMHSPLGTLKQSPELLRCCISYACPKT